ncbi:hypothetical protein HQ550_00820 [bacterium]|nr:hypothetical protein [bacterium]
MRKLSTSLILVIILFAFSGCFGLMGRASKGDALGDRNLSSATPDKDVSITVGFNLLEDKRPKKDVSYMTSVREKVSAEILKILKEIRLFDEVHFPAPESDAIVISGEIKKFDWDSSGTLISYIPALNVLTFLGLPSTRVHSEVEIYLEIKNVKTNGVILGFIESYSKDKKYNQYNFKTDKADQELEYCFNIVLNRIRKKIIFNREKILEVVELASTEVSEPQKDKKPKEIPKAIDLKEEEKKERIEEKEEITEE